MIDNFNAKILNAVQENNRLTVEEIGSVRGEIPHYLHLIFEGQRCDY